MNNELANIKYAGWLEKTLNELIKFPVKGICINAITDTGEAYVNYYNISMIDKLTISGIIQQDAMLDSLAANGFIEYKDDDDDDEEEDGEAYGKEKE